MTVRIFFIQLVLCGTTFLMAGIAEAQSNYIDTDWQTGFHASCGLPTPKGNVQTVAWAENKGDRKLLFTLQKGQIGTCSTDAQSRHRAPYWERAELTQDGRMGFGHVNTVEFEATFLKGFQGKRESFFQIHSWAHDCNAAPPLMMKIHKGKLQILTLQGVKMRKGEIIDQGSHRSVYSKTTKIKKLYGKPSNFRVLFDARGAGRGQLSVYLNGKRLVNGARIDYATCALPYAKIGIYRPGATSRTSQIAFDDLKITRQ